MPEPSGKAVAKEPDDLLAHRRFLDGEVVAVLPIDALGKLQGSGSSAESLASKIAVFYKENNNDTVFVAGVGLVRLDLRAVRNSQWHGN